MRWSFGRAVPLPPGVRASLKALLGDEVDQVKIVEHSIFTRMHGRAIATTRRRCIYLRGSAEDFFNDPVLMLHEYCHVLNQWEPRTLTTLRYVRECLRKGYWNNCFEVEARQFADRHALRLRALLAQNNGPQSTRNA
jgi:hypothetical protein